MDTHFDDERIEQAARLLREGQRATLARLLTLAESTRPQHRTIAERVLEKVERRESFRIAVTGAPGVGKSTLLEALGVHLVEAGHRVAALTIDPSSPVSGGSILGDKTRMPRLSSHVDAFVRPIPSGAALGGVSAHSARCVALCEAAGFDVVFVETVGVGQSELAAFHLVDVFLLLVQPLAGDEMQGIKRGLMEHVDVLAVTKSAAHPEDAERTRLDYQTALSLLHASAPPCVSLDSKTGVGIPELWAELRKSRERSTSPTRSLRRRLNARQALWTATFELVKSRVEEQVRNNPESPAALVLKRCDAGELSPEQAAQELLESCLNGLGISP